MVRKVELNCRNGWAADLWEPAPEGGGRAADAADAPLAGIAEGGAPPTVPEGAPTLSADAAAAETDAPLGVDVLVDQSSSPRSASSVDLAARHGDDQGRPDHRELILRARDINRIRQANRIRPTVAPIGVPDGARRAESVDAMVEEEPAAGTGGTLPAAALPETDPDGRAAEPGVGRGEPGAVDREALAARLAAFVPVPPVPATELRTDLLGLGAIRADAEFRFESVPAVDPDFALPFRERSEATRLRAGFGADDPLEEPVTTDATGLIGSDDPDRSPPLSGEPVHGETSAVDGDGAWPDHPERGREGSRRWFRDRRPLRREAPEVATRLEAAPPRPAPPTGRLNRNVPVTDGPVASDPIHAPEPERDVVHDLVEQPPVESGWGPNDGAGRIAGDVGPLIATAAELALVDDPSYLTGVPRCCRTCRDFRPAEGGERGWCTNRWAFQHRRMVHGDEMPCWGAVGSWWVPHDDVWLDEWDVDHGHPTPLVDAMLTRLASVNNPPAAPRARRRGRT